MLTEPKCFTRRCKHYRGVKQPDGTEGSEVNFCPAFPKGIPAVIAYGRDKHLKKFPGQTGEMVFEKE